MYITVYLGANPGFDPAYLSAVRELGAWIAENRHTLVYGGSKAGLMGELAKSALQKGGAVIGVETERFMEADLALPDLTKLYVEKNIPARRTKMIELGEAFIAFPGGTGTLEEISEVISKNALAELSAPCIFYNLNGYYDGVRSQLSRMISEGFSNEFRQKNVRFASSLEEIAAILG